MNGFGNKSSEAESVFRPPRTEEVYRKIYQQASMGIAVTDWQGLFHECNPAFCDLLGYTEKELRTVDFVSLIHPEDLEANLVFVRRLKAGEISSFEIENRYIHKNGDPVWVRKFVSALHGEEGKTSTFNRAGNKHHGTQAGGKKLSKKAKCVIEGSSRPQTKEYGS